MSNADEWGSKAEREHWLGPGMWGRYVTSRHALLAVRKSELLEIVALYSGRPSLEVAAAWEELAQVNREMAALA